MALTFAMFDPLFVWLESTALSVWLVESTSVFAFPLVLALHTVGLGLVVDESGFLPEACLDRRHRRHSPGPSPAPAIRRRFSRTHEAAGLDVARVLGGRNLLTAVIILGRMITFSRPIECRPDEAAAFLVRCIGR